MTSTIDLLKGFIEALADPTRGAILTELERTGEATATQLARRLGLATNSIYHHMRVLRDLGTVSAPRVVPRETYVEKYYQVAPELRALLGKDPTWLERAQVGLTDEDHQDLFIGMCLTMAQLLQRAARRYAKMDAQEFKQVILQPKLGMLSINDMGQERLESRLQSLRQIQQQEHEQGFAEEGESYQRPQHVVLMAALPLIWQADSDEQAISGPKAPGS